MDKATQVAGVTLRDIARVAGLSAGTVSRALKNEPGLTEATRQMVLEAARELGYDFCKLRPKRLRRLTFLLHRQHNTASSSPFYSPMLHGAEAACRKEGIVLSPQNVMVGFAGELKLIDFGTARGQNRKCHNPMLRNESLHFGSYQIPG